MTQVKQTVSKTVGISPKAKLAGAVPALATLLAVGVHWIVTGEVNSDTLEVGLMGLGLALLAFGGAYLGVPGEAIMNVPNDGSGAKAQPTSGTFVTGGFVGGGTNLAPGTSQATTTGFMARGPIVTSDGGSPPPKTAIKPMPPEKAPVKKPAAKKPVPKKPAAAKPAPKPAAKKPAARKPAPKKPPAK